MKTLLLATAALSSIMLAGAAFADTTTVDIGAVTNQQTDYHQTISDLTANVDNVGKDVSLTSAAIGNSLSVGGSADGKTNASIDGLTNIQSSTGNVAATLNSTVHDVNGNVTATAAALCNSASVTADKSNGSVSNTQSCAGKDPASTMTATMHDIVGEVKATSAAIGNSFSLGTTDATKGTQITGDLNSVQTQTAADTATASLTINNVQENVTGTTAAIGNTFTAVADITGNSDLHQTNSGTTSASMTDTIYSVTKNVTLTSAAIGNTASLTGNLGSGDGTGNVTSDQINSGPITASLSSNVHEINGALNETAAAIGNTATYVGAAAQVKFSQENSGNVVATGDFTALNIGNNSGVTGNIQDATFTVAAIGNSLDLAGTASKGYYVDQTNSAIWTKATSTVNVSEVTGNVTATAAAIGNSASIHVK